MRAGRSNEDAWWKGERISWQNRFINYALILRESFDSRDYLFLYFCTWIYSFYLWISYCIQDMDDNVFKDPRLRDFLLNELNRFRNRVANGDFRKENGLFKAARMATLVTLIHLMLILITFQSANTSSFSPFLIGMEWWFNRTVRAAILFLRGGRFSERSKRDRIGTSFG